MPSKESLARAPSVTVLVNGSAVSVQGPRARHLFGTSARIVYKTRGRLGSVPEVAKALVAERPDWIYCIDLGVPSALLAALRSKLDPTVRLAYELGDPARPLLEPQGRSALEVRVAHEFDRRLPAGADALVFRGYYLERYFREHAAGGRSLPPNCFVPDGVDTQQFRPLREHPDVLALKRAHGLEGRFVVGIVGSLHHNPRLGLFYGWDLAEALATLSPNEPIVGVVVGDGTGRDVLEATRTRLGLGERLKLVGRVSHDQVPLWMNAFDVGLSTQTDDPVGWGRTTAKLPEYLACGTVLAATDVGEAHRLLAATGQTLRYQGLRDDAYPRRLAAHLCELRRQDLSELRARNRDLALEHFDYRVLAVRVRNFLETTPR